MKKCCSICIARLLHLLLRLLTSHHINSKKKNHANKKKKIIYKLHSIHLNRCISPLEYSFSFISAHFSIPFSPFLSLLKFFFFNLFSLQFPVNALKENQTIKIEENYFFRFLFIFVDELNRDSFEGIFIKMWIKEMKCIGFNISAGADVIQRNT